MKKYIYVGGGFDPSDLLYVLPIIEGYIAKKKIFLLFNKSELQNFRNYLKKSKLKLNNNEILNNAKIIDPTKIRFKFLIFVLIKIIKNINYFFQLIFNFSYKEKDFKSKFSHFFWDSCMNNLNDKQLKPPFRIKIYNLIKLLYSEAVFENIIKSSNIKSAFMGHAVYSHGIAIEVFKKNNIPTFVQQNFCVFDLPRFKDNHWSYANKLLFKRIKKKIQKKNIFKFWKLRMSGNLNDADYLKASKISKNKKYKIPKNVVFLHVMKDSPFATIDKTRIFFDYYQWIIETIKILKDSNEMWSLRIHPNSYPWGENTYTVMKEMEKKYFNGKLPSNVIIDNKFASNLEVFKNISRCVTFNGTASIEASCYGIKPIIISDNALSEVDKNYVFKPRNIEQYKKLLLKESDDNCFIQKKNVIEESKLLLFAIYNILSFKRDLNIERLFRNTSIINREQNFKKLIKKTNLNFIRSKLIQMGSLLRSKQKKTLSFKYIDLLK
tara:strand:+ start:164 stop:1642 length:1479 start_codon:yes stop_codon:yes gene_type:complete